MTQISDLVVATSAGDGDELILRQGGEDKRVAKSVLVAGIAHNSLSNVNVVGVHDAIYSRLYVDKASLVSELNTNLSTSVGNMY